MTWNDGEGVGWGSLRDSQVTGSHSIHSHPDRRKGVWVVEGKIVISDGTGERDRHTRWEEGEGDCH